MASRRIRRVRCIVQIFCEPDLIAYIDRLVNLSVTLVRDEFLDSDSTRTPSRCLNLIQAKKISDDDEDASTDDDKDSVEEELSKNSCEEDSITASHEDIPSLEDDIAELDNSST